MQRYPVQGNGPTTQLEGSPEVVVKGLRIALALARIEAGAAGSAPVYAVQRFRNGRYNGGYGPSYADETTAREAYAATVRQLTALAAGE